MSGTQYKAVPSPNRYGYDVVPVKEMVYATDLITDSVYAPWFEPFRKIVDCLLEGPFTVARAYTRDHFVSIRGVRWGVIEFYVKPRRAESPQLFYISTEIHYGEGNPYAFEVTPQQTAYRIEHDLLCSLHETFRGKP